MRWTIVGDSAVIFFGGRRGGSCATQIQRLPVVCSRRCALGHVAAQAATIAALDASAALIAVCSTVAATRPAVNEEVRLFRSRHPDRPVIPVIIEGTYPANFPPALRFALAADGSVTDQPVTILGPDLRKTGDGRMLGLAKIAAGLTGLATDDLHQLARFTPTASPPSA
jgi:hypothetical protein